jgi:hypothetical protein
MKISNILLLCITIMSGAVLSSCSHTEDQTNLSEQEKAEGWKVLFDGKTLTGWHVFNKSTRPSAWSVDSGMLICNPHAKNVKHGDLVTDKVYGDFELLFDWRITKGGNSGLFVNVQEKPEFGATFATGPEYQLVDETHAEPGYLNDLTHKSAAIFGVLPNNTATSPKAGEWNHSKILQKNGKMVFWLNGAETVNTDIRSEQWKKAVAGGSMSRYPAFAITVTGHIAVQDLTTGVAFRNIKIKEL